MSDTHEQSTAETGVCPEPLADAAEFTGLIAEMVADQAPPVFAVVVEYGERVDAQVVAWGLVLDEGAYMVTADGKNQFSLAGPESALKYVGRRADTIARLVWVAGSAPSSW